MPHDVFVSYSAKDKATADAVVAGLEQDGVRCWIAPRDVLAGTNWGKAIVDAIEAARVMVLILSDNSNRSKQVLREVERAVASETIILPFRIEAIDPTGAMAYFLATEHWLDALTPPLKRHIGHLAASIRALMTGEPVAAEPTAPALTAATPTAVGRPVTASPTPRSWLRSPLAIGGLVIAVLATTGILIALSGGRSRTTIPAGSDQVSTTNTATDSSTTAAPTTQSTVTQEPAPDLTLTPLMEVPIVATLTELVEAANRWGQRHDDDRAVALEGIRVLADDAGSEWAARLEAAGSAEELASTAPAGLCQLVDDGFPPDDATAAIAAAAAEVSGQSQADYTFARWVSSVATASVCPEQTPRWAIAAGGLGGGQLFSEDFDDGAA
ncbi:MAG: toll/interleukin-1 receptor domain-containing protein, partial [Acidimicrobiia bacterium]|nr:toll/interleukin-1 receptor domain-containing protein [Acidimicrobiia bacterium]